MIASLIKRFNQLLFRGEFAAAYASLHSALVDDPPHPRVVAALVAVADRVAATDQALSLARQCLRHGRLSSEERTELLFNLANLYDSLGDYDLAFTTCEQANRLKNRRYDLDTDLFLLEETRKVYDARRHQPWNQATAREDAPIFIVGMPRSGTSLLEQVLDMHSGARGLGELDAINQLAWSAPTAVGSDLPYPYVLPQLDSTALDALATRYMQACPPAGTGGKERSVDKMPHNYHFLGFIKQLFPRASILHMRRHPVDTCLSIYFRDFVGRHDYAYDLRDIGHRYILYLAWMELWSEQAGLPVVHVVYEDWMKQPRQVLTQVVDFLGLPWEDALLQHHTSARVVTTASYKQVREPLHQRACERWRHYESHLGPLLEILQPIL